MAVEQNNTSQSETKSNDLVTFDAQSVQLVGKFSDELATFRARKTWGRVLGNYFLLEPDRDFEMAIVAAEDRSGHTLSCTFTSACGRYAFWRLINHQAPEAEVKLCQTRGTRAGSPRSIAAPTSNGVAARDLPWIITGLPNTGRRMARSAASTSLLGRFFRSVKKLF